MPVTDSDLQTRSLQVRNETLPNANTAVRIGQLFYDIVNWVIGKFTAQNTPIVKTPSDFGVNTYVDIAVDSYKNVDVFRNGIREFPVLTFSPTSAPTSMRVDLSETPTVNVYIKLS